MTLDKDYPRAFSLTFERIHFDRGTGIVYADNGETVDPSDGLPVGTFSSQGIMTPDSSLNRAFFVTQFPSTMLQSFNLTEFSAIGSLPIPGESGFPRRIVRWGTNGVAFNTDAGHVWLIGGNFVH